MGGRNFDSVLLLQNAVPHVRLRGLSQSQNYIRPVFQGTSRHRLHEPFSSRRRAVDLSGQQNPQFESGCETVQVGELSIEFSIASKDLLGPSTVRAVESSDRVDHYQRRSLGEHIFQILDDSNLVFEILGLKQHNLFGKLRASNHTFQPVSGERLVSIHVEDPEVLSCHFQSTLHRKYGLASRCFAVQEAYLSKRETASQQHIKSPNSCAERFQS